MPDFEIHFNTVQLINGLSKPFHEANDIMAKRVQMEVRSVKWPWPRETIRKRGKVKVGSPRNIQDEGTFADSQGNEPLDATTHEHKFDTEYALAIVLGAVTSNGTVLPARNVFEEPLKRLPASFETLAQAALARIKDPP